jgi:adsorption protein B
LGSSLVWAINAACAVFTPPLVVWILLSGIDDLVLVVALACSWIVRRVRGRPPAPSRAEAAARPEKRIAILIPLWREHEVIGRMVEHNLSSIHYRAYDFFIGVYPNDGPTIEAVRDLEARFPNVHLALCPHPGPTSKADCLNWIFRRMTLFETESSLRYEILVTHDAEDVIHPDSLTWINFHTRDHDMVQVPVLPLPTPFWNLTHGVYCDEFSEYQTKDMPVRQILGGFIPSNGVGTGYTRRAVELLARNNSGMVFDPESLTEDYENGLRLRLLGCRQMFLCSTHSSRRPVATREYFPKHLHDAVRQRTRWVMGLTLQSWEKHGWRGGARQVYWLWRDRKGLLGNLLTVLANLIFLWGLFTWLATRYGGRDWFAPLSAPGWARPFLVATLVLPLLHMTVRAVCAGRFYGWTFALGVPLRTVWANWLNCAATVGALWRYAAARVARRPLGWLKTSHDYPARPALCPARRLLGEILVDGGVLSADKLDFALASRPAGMRLGEHLRHLGWLTEWQLCEALSRQESVPLGFVRPAEVQRHACRALPYRFARDWKVLPFKIMAGSLLVAAAEPPQEEVRSQLRRLTRLEVRFQLVTPSNFEALAREALRP